MPQEHLPDRRHTACNMCGFMLMDHPVNPAMRPPSRPSYQTAQPEFYACPQHTLLPWVQSPRGRLQPFAGFTGNRQLSQINRP